MSVQTLLPIPERQKIHQLVDGVGEHQDLTPFLYGSANLANDNLQTFLPLTKPDCKLGQMDLSTTVAGPCFNFGFGEVQREPRPLKVDTRLQFLFEVSVETGPDVELMDDMEAIISIGSGCESVATAVEEIGTL